MKADSPEPLSRALSPALAAKALTKADRAYLVRHGSMREPEPVATGFGNDYQAAVDAMCDKLDTSDRPRGRPRNKLTTMPLP